MIKQLPRTSQKEIMERMMPEEFLEDQNLYEAFEEGFKKAWTYKEIERRGWEASAKVWRAKYEKVLKNN